MYHTEEEARHLWCRFAQPGSGNRNTDGSMKPGSGCIGSKCMHWEVDTFNATTGRCAADNLRQ